MSSYRLIMLDLDGTLADSTAGIAATLNSTLAEYGYPARPDSVIMPLIGLPLQVVLERLAPPEGLLLLPQMASTYRRIYAEQAIPNTELFPEVATTLRQLVADGAILTIASSKSRPVSQQVLAHCGVLELFSLLMGNDAVEQLKPHPEMLLHTLAHFDCPADAALMVGDSIHDIGMGQAAGVATCAVTYGAGTIAELGAIQPTYTIDHFAALRALVIGDLPASSF